MSLADDVYAWCRELMAKGPRPFVLGINGPQGAGKTTLAKALEARCASDGLRAVAVSIDDFYLTSAAQRALAARYAGNRYLQSRGYPGTHDVALGMATLRALKGLDADGAEVALPVYDKAVDGGRGERLPVAAWRIARGPLDLVLVEGWMLGFTKARSPIEDPALAAVDELLPAYADWHGSFDAFLQLRMAAPDFVVDWRVEAEAAMRATGRGGMSDAEAKAYVETFLPAYALYPDALEAAPPVPRERLKVVTLGRDRQPCSPRR